MDKIQIARIKDYLAIINKNIADIEKNNKDLVDFCINEVGDRVTLYLNADVIPIKLERILANIVNTGLNRCLNGSEIGNQAISSISDNGQSISYANEVTRYFTSVSDEELFTGFEKLLNRYRRIKVVYPQKND